MQIQLARICVLYEDLQIEFAGAIADQIEQLDQTDATTRRFYFVRRTLATLTEIESAINQLQMNACFRAAKAWWSVESLKTWDEAVAFFSGGHAFLRQWRNDLGGHFHDSAAEFAIDNIDDRTIGMMEVYLRGRGADVKMPFAYELVAVAMTKNNAALQNESDFLHESFSFLLQAGKMATYASQVLVKEMIVPRFR